VTLKPWVGLDGIRRNLLTRLLLARKLTFQALPCRLRIFGAHHPAGGFVCQSVLSRGSVKAFACFPLKI
jgi:hypothetical protein